MVINMEAVAWLALLVILLLIEALTLGLTTIWFAGGALAGFILAVAQAELLTQIIVFCAVSVLLLAVLRPLAARSLNGGRVRTNAESLIGAEAVVTQAIDNLANRGQVQVQGQYWTARTESDHAAIETGKTVKIKKISGVKLIVEEA